MTRPTDRSIPTFLFVAVVLAATVPAFADDIKLKSGETYTDVEVLDKKPDKLRIKTLDGKTLSIKVEDIAEHIEKKTAGQEFDEKAKELKTKADLPKMVELAKWGLEKGAKIHATKLLNKVLGMDKENEDAHVLLGHEKIDGKWLSGKELDAYKAKLEEAKMAAQGLVNVGGKWVGAYEARAMKAGMVEHEGEWYSKEDQKKAAAGMIFRDGSWLPKDAQEKLDQGLKPDGSKWIDPREQNAAHKDILKNPWVVESLHFRIRGNLNYDRLQQGLVNLEQLWPQLRETFGDGPLATMSDKKPTVVIGIDVKDYNALWGEYGAGADDRASFQSSNYPANYNHAQKTAITYYLNEFTYQQWMRHCATWAYLGGFTDVAKLRSPMVETFAAYFECTTVGKGKYETKGIIWDKLQGLNWESPRKVFADWKIEHKQAGMAKLGFLMHFLKSNYPDDVKTWMPKFLNNGASYPELLDPIEKREGNDLKDKLNEFYNAYIGKK